MTGDSAALVDTLLPGNETNERHDNVTLRHIEWDNWDVGLWTPEQRRSIELGVVPQEVYVFLGVALSLVVVFGIVANATILYVFAK